MNKKYDVNYLVCQWHKGFDMREKFLKRYYWYLLDKSDTHWSELKKYDKYLNIIQTYIEKEWEKERAI